MRRTVHIRAAFIRVALVTAVACGLGLVGPPATAVPNPSPGAPGIGDPYFPGDGNGGYDVKHYDLALSVTPATHKIRARARLVARATESLSSFNLDLVGLTIDAVRVNGRPAQWSRSGQELTVTPAVSLARGAKFRVTVRYHGRPVVLDDPRIGQAGVFPTADGLLVIGEPHVAATWFPVNDHPLDKASYDVRGADADAGSTRRQRRLRGDDNARAGGRRWTCESSAPMASYLTTATVGRVRRVKSYRRGVGEVPRRHRPGCCCRARATDGRRFATCRSAARPTSGSPAPSTCRRGGGRLSDLGCLRDTDATGTTSSSRRTRPGPRHVDRRCADLNGHTAANRGRRLLRGSCVARTRP